MSCDRSMRWMSVCLVALLVAPGGCFDFASRLPPPPPTDAPERAAAIQPLVGPGLVGGRLQARF